MENTSNNNDDERNDNSEIKGILYNEKTINNLSNGVLEIYQPRLEGVKNLLLELTTKQTLLVEQLHNENLKLAWKQNSEEYHEMFRKIQLYRNKLIGIKTDMRTLHDRSQKLVKRAIRLQQLKERDEHEKKLQREKELNLIGK